ncbi:protein mono-ADP-ribosyltransferase PARP10 [Puntigrus tetrazona]|uniref:protein mono-ADP-ribosyltransferase PARP10 n=1 Tax=Puntigrus tetrazona TaxID=1606681 RepID=UPI001C8A66C2|nr:protein mono-ADP-ribosyltransferase PARP10 [Puntigrus tetrazona]XP_043073695.1 protein mono-ADP-ribosyltransferase PARP10 [Puntigrus tetrazona]XP_043073696.1 protein mono-ADP-ribosyltransferase PARP10 [Puntigrus tetrazona]
MAEGSPEERSLEILDIPDALDEDLLLLYFDNKRRSGGGNLVSFEKRGNHALAVFEDAETAARVVSRSHVLQNIKLTVRRKPPKDPGKLLLRGLSPHTSLDYVELYVESVTGMDFETDFILYQSPNKDLVLVHLKKPIGKDFQTLKDEVSKKPLNGAQVTLEQVECTDSIVVANLSPAFTEDMLELYFESNRAGGADVLAVSMLADGRAKVSFKDVKTVDHVLQNSHLVEGTALVVEPYFDFLQALEDQNAQDDLETLTDGNQPQVASAQSPTVSVPVVSSSLGHEAALTDSAANLTATASAPEPSVQQEFASSVSVPDANKYHLLTLSSLLESLKKDHPKFEVGLGKGGVQIKGPDQIEGERLKNEVLQFLASIVEDSLMYDRLKAEFLGREDVKKRLSLSLKSIPSTYSVSDCAVSVTSPSRSAVKQARDLIESQISEFTVPIAKECESMLSSTEWSDLLVSLDVCSARLSDAGGAISAITLTGMEKDNKEKMLAFLSTSRQRETVLSMEPGMLKFLQLHHQDLLADMGEVILFPLETGDGLSIQGEWSVCQSAAELLSAIIGSVFTKTIVVTQPGISRFLLEEEGVNILGEMTAKFEVFIDMAKVHWEPLEDDILELAWKITTCQNFQRGSSANSIQSFSSGLTNGRNSTDAHTSARIEEAKKILAVIGGELNPQPSSLAAIESVDLYSDQSQDISAAAEKEEADQPQSLQAHDLPSSSASIDVSSLDEDASLLLAIQMSMEVNQRSDAEDIQKALELSRKDSMPNEENTQLERAFEMSLQDAVRSANTAEIGVFANYNHDLVRVDIALGKKVGLRQCEEKVENKSLRKLSSHQKRCVELIKRKHAVEISLQGTTAVLSGFKEYVSEAVADLKNVLRRTENMMTDAEILKSVQWVWYEQGSSSKAVPYPPEATVFIENAWKMKQKKIDVLFNNQLYTIDLEKMEEHSLASGKSVPVKRKMLSTGDLYTDDAEEDYSLLSSMPEVCPVDVDSDEFQNVVKDFYDTLQDNHNKIRIIKVDKLMNRLLHDQYRLKKVSIEQSSSEPQVERTLYHGTSETSVKEICIQGFNRSFCGKNATVYGQGVYFAVNASLSVSDTYSPPNADGHKFIFVARVLTGDFTVGKYDYKTAPLKDTSGIPVRYHSVTDQMGSPTLFVIFNDTQAYPEYLITCKKIYG